jgi:hypothetical protein
VSSTSHITSTTPPLSTTHRNTRLHKKSNNHISQNDATPTTDPKISTLPKEATPNPFPLPPSRHPILQTSARSQHRNLPQKFITGRTRANDQPRHSHPPKSNPPRGSIALHPRRDEPRRLETAKSNRSAANPQCRTTTLRRCRINFKSITNNEVNPTPNRKRASSSSSSSSSSSNTCPTASVITPQNLPHRPILNALPNQYINPLHPPL